MDPVGFNQIILFNNPQKISNRTTMRASLEALVPRIAELKAAPEVEKEKFWLCIVLSHPSVSDKELIHLASEFGMKPLILCKYAAYIGRLNRNIINKLNRSRVDGSGHALKFAALSNLEQFLTAPASAGTSVSSTGFFAIPVGHEGATSAAISTAITP